jgi:hypothetical protein
MCEPRVRTLAVVSVPSRGSLSGIGGGGCDGYDSCRRQRQDRDAPKPCCDLRHADSFLHR